MTEDLSSTPLGQWIVDWLSHQRSLGRDYGGTEWILKHLQRFVVVHLHASDLDQASFLISGATPSGICRPRHVGADN